MKKKTPETPSKSNNKIVTSNNIIYQFVVKTLEKMCCKKLLCRRIY